MWAGGFLKSQWNHFDGVLLDRFGFIFWCLKKGDFDGAVIPHTWLDSKTEDFMVDCFFVLGRLNAGDHILLP